MTSINLSLIRRNNFRCLLVLFATLGAAVDPTLLAQIDPRRMTPVVLAAGGPTGAALELGAKYLA